MPPTPPVPPLPALNPDQIKAAMVSPRWSALLRTDADVNAIKTWDTGLLRESRVLVPMDVQALYVPPVSAGNPAVAEQFVRLPFVLTAPDGAPPEPMPAPFTAGAPRPPGVHLHWALPDALLGGTLQDRTGQPNRLDLPALPDRWVVLRLIAPRDALTPYVRGWVIEADTARVTPLESWTGQPDPTVPQSGRTVAREDLNGSAGGSIVWTAGYDASASRFALYDSLEDLPAGLPGGALDDLATYLVAGWWSDPTLDPLDGAQTTTSLHTRLGELGWALTTDAEGGDSVDLSRTITAARREAFVPTADRYTVRAGHLGASGLKPATGPGARGLGAGEAAMTVEDRLAMLAEPVKRYLPSVSVLADAAASVLVAEPSWPRAALLHGAVHGVPVAGPVVADARPDPSVLGVAFGHSGDDLAATLVAAGLGAETADERRGLERILSAFTGQLLPRLGTADGLVDVEEHEHSTGFASLPGGDGGVERVTLGATSGPFDAGRAARSAVARSGPAAGSAPGLGVEISWAGRDRTELLTTAMLRAKVHSWAPADPERPQRSEVREIRRPAPRFFRPVDPMVALRGPCRSLRHQGDSRFSSDGRLFCRWPSQVPQGYAGLVDGSRLLPTLSSGALPPELVTLAREALTQSPYLWKWLADVATAQGGADGGLAARRILGEVVLRYGTAATYDGSTAAFTLAPAGLGVGAPGFASTMTGRLVADELRRFSLVQGVDASPVAVTAWTQPWIPIWLEWEAETALADRFEGWTLGPVDLEPPGPDAVPPPATPPVRTFTGRAPLHAGTATVLAKSIEAWASAEDALDKANQGEADEATEVRPTGLADAVEPLDIVTAGLDGMRDELLGLPADNGVVRPRVDGALAPVTPAGPPQLLVAGSVRLTRARLVDAFGRTLDVPVEGVQVPARDEVPAAADALPGAPALRVHPRIPRPSRWLFRLVDAADLTQASREATIDQSDPLQMVNPVAGFLLPDHIDEALELFDVAGQPLGQLMESPVGGGVMWEIAPGRAGPADSGPLQGLAGAQLLLGHVAAGMVAADAVARKGLSVGDEQPESALSALLRAIDTTLWTVDTFASMGTEHIAGLVGRPVAVVRATLRLDVDDDLDELDLADPDVRRAREAAYRDLADRAFPVRIGEITRSDDGTLAFFVDDDYTTVHLVDKVVREAALATSPWEGQLGRFGESATMPAERAITHPYLVADDELLVHPGQVVHLTILMHPAGKVHLTSGVQPRKDLALARDWVQPGLAVIAPSARIGPVLLDPDQVRLPKISAFGTDQVWTRRDTPSTWKDDPILAATQTALLPQLPHQIEEGYIRISPIAPAPPPSPQQPPPAGGAS